jgi:hypothetical protein
VSVQSKPLRLLGYSIHFLCVFLLSLAPLFIPITANLEFEYAFLFGVATLLVIPLLGLIPFASQLTFASWPFVFIALPFAALATGAYLFGTKTCPCSPGEYLSWMLVQWYPAFVLSYAGFFFVRNPRIERPSKGKRAVLLYGLYLILALSICVLLWRFPQKRYLSFLLGYLHGPIYDRWIPLDPSIILWRGCHLLASFMLCFAVQSIYRGKRKVFMMAVAGVLLAAGIFHARTYAVSGTGQARLDQLMPFALHGEGFSLHYTGKSSRAPALFEEIEFHFQDLQRQIQAPVETVHIYLYPSDKDKKIWFGGGETDVTDVVGPTIHISDSALPHPTVRHELVHALMAPFAPWRLGFNPNMALTEGIAVALAPEKSPVDLHSAAYYLLTHDKIKSVSTLLSPFFWRESSARAYSVAGSLVKYIMDAHGFDAVKDLYGGATFGEVLGVDEAQFLSQWREFVNEQPHEDNLLETETLFRYPGTLHDRCLHAKVNLARSPEHWWERIRQPLGWQPGNDYWPWRLAVDPDDLGAKLGGLRNRAYLAIKESDTKNDELIKEIFALRTWPPKNIEDIELAILASDLQKVGGDDKGSASTLKEIANYGKAKPLPDNLVRQLVARTQTDLLADSSKWRRFLAGWDKQLPLTSVSATTPWMSSYLYLRNRAKISASELKTLARMTIPAGIPATFRAEWYELLATRYEEAGRRDDAANAWNHADRYARDSIKPYLALNRARVLFAQGSVK